MSDERPQLGTVIRNIRAKRGWTLKEMSDAVNITVSTLSKIERGKLTLSYDKLQKLSEDLDIDLSELFARDPIGEPDIDTGLPAQPIVGRRSLDTLDKALFVPTRNADSFYLCTDLRKKKMVPVIVHVKARTMSEFGPLSRHKGEEFIYVIRGSVLVVTEFYSDFIMDEGECMYFDSEMAHAFLIAPECDGATILSVGTVARAV